MGAIDNPPLLTRHRLTVADYYRMGEAGIFAPEARVELIEGEIIDIEACPEDFWVFYAERGYLAHTNHFTAPNLLCRVPDKGKTILPDTFQRLGRIDALLSASDGCVDFDRCAELLSDHANYPDSICRHEDPRDPAGKRLASVYATVMDLTDGVVWFSDSNPCKRAFSPFAARAGGAAPEREE